ncbi:MAG: DUF29 domain-containing protein [Microcystaceae cyanobacterium]
MTISVKPNQLRLLYQEDESLWLAEMVKLLRENRLEELDIDNLVEELEALGRRDKNRVESLLRQIIIHFLCLQYWAAEYDYNHRHWQGEIATFRIQLNRALTTNLNHHLRDHLEEIYQEAVFIVNQKTGLTMDTFPVNCPYSLTQLLDKKWLP